MKFKKVFYTLFLIIFVLSNYSVLGNENNSSIDSLVKIINNPQVEDTTKYNVCSKLGRYFIQINIDSSFFYYRKSIHFSKYFPKPLNQIKKGFALKNIGIDYFYKEKYGKAIDVLDSALQISKKLLSNHLDSSVYKQTLLLYSVVNANKGIVYYSIGEYEKALENYFVALKTDTKLGDLIGQATDLGNIGLVYSNLSEYDKALNYFLQALTIEKRLNNKRGIGRNYGNIAIVYSKLSNFDKALEYYKKAIEIDKELGYKRGLVIKYGNIGLLYKKKGDYEKAHEYYIKAIEGAKDLDFKTALGLNLTNIAEIYIHKKKYIKAKKYLIEAENILKSINSKYQLLDVYRKYIELYTNEVGCNKAFDYFLIYESYKDSIYNEDKNKAITYKELKYSFDKKHYLDSLKFAEKQKVDQLLIAKQNIELKNRKTIQFFITLLLVVILIFTLLILKRYRVTNKQKSTIEKQNKLLSIRNKEITDSITYAKRIQKAILPSNNIISKYLPNSFILYLPKDIISGDFYWLETVVSETSNTVYFAAADCTGHGVPGAMVSVVCSNALTKTVVEEKITEPGKILDRTRELVIERFAKSSEDVKDGMDISLCAIDFKNMALQWAGANNPLWIVRNVELEMLNDESKNEYSKFNTQNLKLIEVKPDKQPIGKVENPQPFTTHTIKLQKGDTIYIFTDGFADQFGGPKGKKFKYKQFKELLLSIKDKSMDEQKEKIEDAFIKWKRDVDQVDDVCVIGVRI
ncbi:MAG: hypothetical protein Kow0079_05830 [Vicingaceae bacterium]